MKKSIICFGMLLVAVSSFANYSDTNTKKIIPIYIYGPTPLCMAISKGDTAFATKLIEYGADVNEKSFGMTPLMFAARYNCSEIITLLVAKGVNVKEKDEKGLTALNYAERSNATAALALLKAL